MIGKLDMALGFHENALRLRAERQQVLASNIANADTPNFKARDFDFGHPQGRSRPNDAIGGEEVDSTDLATSGTWCACSMREVTH